MKTFPLVSVFLGLLAALPVHAKLITQLVDYEQDGVALEGYLAYDDSFPSATRNHVGRPGVLIAHEWWGLNDYIRGRADQLAGLGYIAFALDMYGKGVYTTHSATAGELAQPFYGSALMADRARAGLDQLLKTGLVDDSRVAAIGYCFGGSTVLALAFSGAPLAAVVSFHGSLIPVPPGASAKTKAKFLICHGAMDPFVKKEQVDAFIKSMNDQKFDYQFISYSGALHAFTNPDADQLGFQNRLHGIGYNAAADHRSWAAMRSFFNEVFGPN
jgi:dienelactone hydrolase